MKVTINYGHAVLREYGLTVAEAAETFRRLGAAMRQFDPRKAAQELQAPTFEDNLERWRNRNAKEIERLKSQVKGT